MVPGLELDPGVRDELDPPSAELVPGVEPVTVLPPIVELAVVPLKLVEPVNPGDVVVVPAPIPVPVVALDPLKAEVPVPVVPRLEPEPLPLPAIPVPIDAPLLVVIPVAPPGFTCTTPGTALTPTPLTAPPLLPGFSICAPLDPPPRVTAPGDNAAPCP